MDPLEDSGFVAPALERDGAAHGFGSSDYSFFGNLNDVEDSLDGALEIGLEAPPEEELPDPDLLLEADEDLSYASMFVSALRSPRDDTPATNTSLHLQVPNDTESAPPTKPKLGSIALGGLLTASTPTDAAFSATGTPAFAHTPSPQLPTPPAGLNGALPPPAQLQQHQQQAPPMALTPQELEAQLRGGLVPPSPPVLQVPLPPHLQQQQMQMQVIPPFQGHPHYGAPPPPLAHLFGPPGMPPPGGAFPQRPLVHQPGVFTPDMIMQQAQQQQAQEQQQQQGVAAAAVAGNMPFPPQHMMHPFHRPPPPALGQGPPPPPYPQQQQLRYPPPQRGGQVNHHPTLAQRLRALNLADRPDTPQRVPLRRQYNSKMMSHDDIETILYMQWRPLHQEPPYMEDYYYQAFVYKYYGQRNKRSFAPESVRELAPTERAAEGDVAFVKLEGLGKVPFSNVRRPRPLMDLAIEGTATNGKDGSDKRVDDQDVKPNRRLDQEPMLAARIMTEDCMALILDVQDIDRIFVAAAQGAIENEMALLQRRTLLMDGLAASLRLPETPSFEDVGALQNGEGGRSDGVFLRLLSLPKGKTLAAKALRIIYPPLQCTKREKVEPNLKLVWAHLRHARLVFEAQAVAAAATQHALAGVAPGTTKNAATTSSATNTTGELYGLLSKVALALVDVLKRLHDAGAVIDAFSAIVSGDLLKRGDDDEESKLLPLFAPGERAADTKYPWLAQVLVALLQRASELDLSKRPLSDEAEKEKTEAAWIDRFSALYGAVVDHVGALDRAVEEAGELDDAAVVEEIRSFVPVGLVKSMVPLCSKEQEEKLRGLLASLGV